MDALLSPLVVKRSNTLPGDDRYEETFAPMPAIVAVALLRLYRHELMPPIFRDKSYRQRVIKRRLVNAWSNAFGGHHV
jgi:hypothetical protein